MTEIVFAPHEDEANCALCIAEWTLDGIFPAYRWWHLFWNPEPKPHLIRFLAVMDDRYLCEKHYREERLKRAVTEAEAGIAV